jgi:hypothetical protein
VLEAPKQAKTKAPSSGRLMNREQKIIRNNQSNRKTRRQGEKKATLGQQSTFPTPCRGMAENDQGNK